MILKFYTDGACSGNPGPGGYSCVIVTNDEVKKIIAGNKQDTTNNEMELMGILEALRFVKRSKLNLVKHRAEVFSDSAYCCNAINQGWYINWANNGWRTKKGDEVKNRGIWEEIYALKKAGIKFSIIKLKGHAGNEYNELADTAAKAEVQKIK